MSITLYVIATPDNKLLAQMNESEEYNCIFGAVIPGVDGNYYSDIFVSGYGRKEEYTLGAEGWLKYLVEEAIPQGKIKVHEEFSFDPDTLRVVELQDRQNLE